MNDNRQHFSKFRREMKKEMMKITVILSFLLCWSFVSSNPHREKLNDKSVNELNSINDASDTPNLARKESSDEASSGKDWGGNFLSFLKFLKFLNQKDLTDENNQADNESFLDTLISQGSKFIENLTSKNNLSHIPVFGNIITWVEENVETLGNLFTDEKTEKFNDRAKRDLGTSIPSGLLWAKSHKGGISEHLLKLSEGSTSNVLRSEKATVAEALNGRAAIRKILARAKAKAAKAAQHRNLFDNDDFSKWFISGSAFDTDIFSHPFHRPSYNAKITRHSEAENTDSSNHNTFSVLHHASRPANQHHLHEIKRAFNTLSVPTAVDTAVTERSHTKLLHKPEHQERLSSKLQITSGEKDGHETNGMLHKPAVSPNTHGSLSHEDEENTGPRHASSHAHAPHMHFRVTEDEEIGNGVPKWRHVKWTSSRKHAPHISHSADSNEFDTSDEMEGYKKGFIFKTSFKPGEEPEGERLRTEYRKKHKFSDMNIDNEIDLDDLDDEELIAVLNSYKRTKSGHNAAIRYYGVGDREYYDEGFDNIKNHHLANKQPLEYDSSINSHREENNMNKNKHSVDGVQRSIIYSTKSNAETEEAVEDKQSGNMLITKISTDTSTRKPMNVDIEHYHSRDQSVAANGATSFSSSLSDEKGHTNNVLASASVDDGSAVKMKTENDGVLRRTHSVIDNDATSAEVEMGFSRIKSHPSADLPLAHSSLSHAHSKIHLGNEKVHHISGYQRSTANTAASSETTMDAKMSMESQNKNHDLRKNQIVSANAASSAEATISVENERQHGLFKTVSLDNSCEEDYMRAGKKFTDLKGTSHHNGARHKTSIEVIDIDDRSAEVLIPKLHKFKKGHALHNVNFYDLNDQEMRGDRIIETDKSAENLKKSEINYDGLEEEKEEEQKQEEKEKNIATDPGMSEKSNTLISNEHGFHDRHSQHTKGNKHDQHNHHHSEYNYHKDHSQRNNAHNQYSQHTRHAFNQYARDAMSSSTASDATEFEARKKYLYFIRERERENNESNASLESSTSLVKKTTKQNNAMNEEISSLDRGGKKRITDKDNHVHLKKYKNKRGPIAHSKEINKIISTKNNEEREIKSEDVTNNQSKNRETVTRAESLISDGSIDTASRTSKSVKTSNNNNHRKEISMETMTLKNSRADAQTKTERVYDAHGRNENVDISTKQTAGTVQSTDSESNLQQASWKTSTSETDKQIMTEEQASENEKIFSSDAMNGYQNHNDLQKTSVSSKSTIKSQMQTKHSSNEKSESSHEINTNVETLTGTISSSDAMTKSRSNIQNTIASSKSSKELHIEPQHNWSNLESNKKYSTNGEASTSTTDSIGINNKQESISENTLSFSRSSARSKQVENYSDNLKNTLSGVVTKSSESEVRAKQKSDNFESIPINSNTEISSIMSDNEQSDKNEQLFSSPEESQTKIDYHLVNHENNHLNAISKTSAEAILSNTIKDEDQSDLQKSLSSAISSKKSQAKSEHNSLRNSQTSVSTAESSAKSTSFSDNENGYLSDSSKSSSSNLLEKTRMENKQYSDDMRINRKENIGVITKTRTESSGNVKNHQQESVSSSSSSSYTKSQVENKNIKTSMSTTTSNNVISDMDQHNLLFTSSSSQNIGKNDLNYQKFDPQIADNVARLTDLTHINDDNHGYGYNILKAKWLVDSTNEHNIEKSDNDKSPEKSEFIKQNSEDALSATTSVKTGIKNIQNIIASPKNSKTETWIHDKYYLKEGKATVDDSITGISNKAENNHENELLRTSSLSGSQRISEENKENHIDILQNNRESATTASLESLISTNNRKSQNELKETTSAFFTETQKKQNNLNVSRKKSKGTINKTAIDTTSDIINNLHRDDLLKETLAISNKKIQTDDKLNDKTEVNANSIIGKEINSKVRMKDSKDTKFMNEMVSATFNSFNNENQNNMLKVTSSDDLYAKMSQKNKHISNSLSDVDEISNINIQNKDPYETMSSVDTKTQSTIYHKPDISKHKEEMNSNIHKNINEWRTKFHTTGSSSSYAESRDKNAMKTTVSAESITNSINEDIRNYDLIQDKFLSDPSNVAQADKEHGCGNQKVEIKKDDAKTSTEISSSSISQTKHKYDAKEKASVASQLQQHDLNIQKKDKAITSNTLLSTEEANSSEMRNARQELLERVTSSNSRTEVQHERISDIVKESSEVTASAATSAQTMSSGKIESESEGKLIRDSKSYAKSQATSNIDSNISKEGKIIASTEMSANSAASNHLQNIRRNKLTEKSSLFDPGHDAYTENQNRNVPINNLANAADATVSAKETSSSIIKGKYQSGATKTASNSHAEAQTEHEYDSSLERQSIETTFCGNVKERAESKNTNNMQESLKAAANTVTSANAISSSSVESINEHDASKMSSSNSYVELKNKINTHTRNFARGSQESAITQTSATSLVSDENQGRREENFMRKVLRPNSQNQRIMEIGNHNDNVLKKNLHNSEDTAISKQAGFGRIKNEHQDNLMEATSLVNANVESVQKDESSSFKTQHLITTDSMASSNSEISDYMNNIVKNDPKELTATSSGNSYAKSSVQDKNDADVLRKDHTDVFSEGTSTQAMIASEFKDVQRDKSRQMTSSSDSYAKTQIKSENTNSIKEDSDTIINERTETISSNNIKDTGLHGLFNLLANSAAEMKTDRKSISQEGIIKENLLKTSSNLFSKAQTDSAHNSRILEKDHENSAMINTMTKMKNSNRHDQQNYLHKTESGSTQDNQHNIKSISSANSYVTSQATSEDIAKSEGAKEDGEVTVNLSTLGKAEAHNMVKGAHSYDWLVTTSDATLAEERTQNKDKFNVLGEAKEVAVYTETSAEAAASNGIKGKHRDIHVEDPSDCQDSWNTAKNIQDAVAISSASTETTVLKKTENKHESKNILDNKMTTLASNDAYAEILINDKEKCSVSHNLESSANTEGMLHSTTSAMSSASTSDSTNMGLKKIYTQIDDEISSTPAISPMKDNARGEDHLSSVETSLLPPDKMNRCNENVKTKEFINEVTSLYKMLDKQRDSEILLMKKNPEGPVQIASLKNSVPPLIAYRLVPREVYEKIRTIIANKQIFRTDCPLSNS